MQGGSLEERDAVVGETLYESQACEIMASTAQS